MEINTHLPTSVIQKNDTFSKIFSQNVNQSLFKRGTPIFNDVGAYQVSSNTIADEIPNVEFANNIATFKDMISTAQDTLSKMKNQGEDIYSLIQKAQSGECDEKALGAINSEIASRISEINKLYQNAEFMGVNPFSEQFGIMIPNWQDLISVQKQPDEVEQAESEEETDSSDNQITNLLTSISFDFDMSGEIDGTKLDMTASATINIGFTDEGALQIVVDASLDYDLSGITTNGADSQNAFDIISRFLSLITGKQNDLGMASNFLDGIFENSINIGDWGSYFPEITGNGEDVESSTQLKGRIVQNAVITLDSSANQIPSIAINLL